jgi:hypothetical protein
MSATTAAAAAAGSKLQLEIAWAVPLSISQVSNIAEYDACCPTGKVCTTEHPAAGEIGPGRSLVMAIHPTLLQ